MAKRVRGKRPSAYRPGGQGPTRGKEPMSTNPTSTSPATPDIDAAIADATDDTIVETTELAVAEPSPSPTARRRKGPRRGARAKSDSLDVRAAAEESWVREDLRNIGIITLVLVVGIGIAWVVFVAMNLANLY